MALPSHQDLSAAVLEFLGKQPDRMASSKEVADRMAKKFRLSEADLRQRTGHARREMGESSWKLQLRRVKYDLSRQGLVQGGSENRGAWRLS